MQELFFEDLQKIVSNSASFSIKIPIVVNDEFRINETIEILKKIEENLPKAEFFVYCPNLFNQIKVDEPDPKHNSKAIATGMVLHSMHLDTLPYSSVIVVVFRGAEQTLRDVCSEAGAEYESIESL